MQLLVAIVNYRTPELTIDCLRSLAVDGMPRDGRQVVVVDNRSSDGSAERIGAAIEAEGWSSWAAVVAAPRNGGFAYGNNVAVGAALKADRPPEYVLLLNSDTLVRPGAIDALVRVLDAHPNVGIVGSRLEDPDGTPQCSDYRFPSLRSEFSEAVGLGLVDRLFADHLIWPGHSDVARPADWVAGASMLVRSAVFRDVGLMDESYFLYYEEVDLCLRAARAGWSCRYEPASRVVHLVGKSSGVTSRTEVKRRPGYWFDSRRRYFVQNHGRLYAALVDLVWSGGYAARRLKETLLGRPNSDAPRLLFDYLRHSVFVRGFGT
jgi:N-acetylglucosaminyl-diphospho-decaprenol L-rhamnosyltransferase